MKRIPRGGDESAEYQIQLGRQLALHKQECIAAGLVWRTYTREFCGISRRWADRLIRIGNGVISVDECRAIKRKSQRASRRRHGKNGAAKTKFLYFVDVANDAGVKAKLQIVKNELSQEDKDELRMAVSEVILVWQQLFDVLQ